MALGGIQVVSFQFVSWLVSLSRSGAMSRQLANWQTGNSQVGFPQTAPELNRSALQRNAGSPSSGIRRIAAMQDYRRLLVWKRAHTLAIEVRRTTRRFPRTGYGALQSQIMRAAESVVFNIVEGCGGRSPKEFARFLDISIKSTSEVECQLELAKGYGVLGHQAWQRLTIEAVEIRRMLCGLRKKVLGGN